MKQRLLLEVLSTLNQLIEAPSTFLKLFMDVVAKDNL